MSKFRVERCVGAWRQIKDKVSHIALRRGDSSGSGQQSCCHTASAVQQADMPPSKESIGRVRVAVRCEMEGRGRGAPLFLAVSFWGSLRCTCMLRDAEAATVEALAPKP
jgi:hypothetical protein